ncbi:MAG: hypothetical protein HYY16_02125 [Planctomycetes bacterium]|nr:hypothetical protein [Planctomycetota bacterium]
MTFALLATLLLQDDLRVTKVELVDSKCGAAREKIAVRPQEWAILRFEVEGLTSDQKGERRLSFSFTVADVDGETIVKETKGQADGSDALPPSPGFVVCEFRVDDTVKGPVVLTLTLTDKVSGKKATHDVKVEILPVSLAVVTPHFATDREGDTHRAPVFAVGEYATLFYDVVGLKNSDKGLWYQQDLEIVDAATGKRVSLKEKLFDYKSDRPMAVVNAHYTLLCSRAGKFVFRILGRDMNDEGKAVTREVPFEIREP